MKKKHKRLLSIILCCSMMLGLLPFAAMAEDAAPATNPFADATTIYVSNNGTGNGETEATPTTLKEAVAQINKATQNGDKVPAFIISLTENLEFPDNTVVKDGDFTLKNYNTMILGNGHTMESVIGIKADGTDTNVYLGNAEKNAFTINVDSDSSPTLAAGNGATIHMYDGVVVHHGPANAHCDSAIALHQTGKFKMHGGEISNCHTLTGTIFADDSSSITILGGSIHDNNCISDSDGNGNGGAMYIHDTQTTLTDCIVENNTASRKAGGIYSNPEQNVLTLDGKNLIRNNKAGSGDNAFDSNLYLEVIGSGETASQSTLFVDENFDKNSNIGVTMETIAGAEENKKP